MSEQLGFFGAPVVHPISESPTHPDPKATRRAGLAKARESEQEIHRLMLRLYRERESLTDNEMGRIVNLPAARISARRNPLVATGKVEAKGSRKDPITKATGIAWGVKNTAATEEKSR